MTRAADARLIPVACSLCDDTRATMLHWSGDLALGFPSRFPPRACIGCDLLYGTHDGDDGDARGGRVVGAVPRTKRGGLRHGRERGLELLLPVARPLRRGETVRYVIERVERPGRPGRSG